MSINSKICVIALCFHFLFHCLIVFTMYNFVDVLTNVSKNDLPQKKKKRKKILVCIFDIWFLIDAHLLLGLKNYVLWI